MSQAKASKKKTPKRKRPGPEEQYQQECIANYSKLHHTSSKLLHREGKLVKSFECQKIVRSLKSANDTLQRLLQSSGETKEAEKARQRVSSLESKLERTKKLELDLLVSTVLKRLGVTSLHPDNRSIPNEKEEEDPSIENKDIKNDDEEEEKEEVKQPPSQDKHTTNLIEQMLRHKRLSTAMDQINDKVSDYQSWITHRQELVSNNGDNFESKKKSGKKTKKNSGNNKLLTPMNRHNETLIVAQGGSHATKRRKIDLGGHEGTSGLFIGSLSGQMAEGYDHDDDHDGGYDDDDEGGDYETKKKNRPGQRARKAKAMAIEAKKAGRTWDSSINWREKKKEDNAQHRDGNGGREEEVHGHRGRDDTNKRRAEKRNGGNNNNTKPSAKVKSQDIATMGKSWKEEGKAHPSWAAAAAQKSQGIVEFKGTKITF